jgi:TM2 domain-containing membrane protein YozV
LRELRSTGTAYILCIIGFFGFAGIHRFYLGRPLTGLLWLFSGGLCGIGTIVDLFLIPDMVDTENR